MFVLVERIVPFTNLTEEYDVIRFLKLELLFEKDGSVPLC